MKVNRFYIIIIIRVILITLNSFVLIWFFTETHRPATTLLFFILLIIQTISLIRYLNRVNRDLANFLIYLQENDTSLLFSRNRVEKNFRNVMSGLNDITKRIQAERISREAKHQYLKAVIEHLEVGVLSINANGMIEMANQAVSEIFGIRNINSAQSLTAGYPELERLFAEDFTEGVIKINAAGKISELAVKAKHIRIEGEDLRIYSFQNIRNELETRELDSWKKLIRVLRHEIMNSITPITTLTVAIKRSFTRNGQLKPLNEIDSSNIHDALTSAEVIEERSKGLISFVDKFRNITDLPRPVFKSYSVSDMFGKVQLLFQNALREKDITLTCISEPDLYINADEQLLEQVLINLVKNSLEAIDRHGNITLKALSNGDQKTCIQVTDSGIGIPAADLENIFVPSFTTKENGMGVGLSICKQIIQLHHGEIKVNSTPGETVFEILLS